MKDYTDGMPVTEQLCKCHKLLNANSDWATNLKPQVQVNETEKATNQPANPPLKSTSFII
jgi:hypothetical protein